MILKIKKGTHRGRPSGAFNFLRWLLDRIIISDAPVLRYAVTFDPSCRYQLGTVDQMDINKLFGLFYASGIHNKSARIGWRYDAENDLVELWAYCYINGKRVTRLLTFVPIGHTIRLSIEVTYFSYLFSVVDGIDSVSIPHQTRTKYISFKAGLFFGGDSPAPHDMTVQITKL